MRPTQVHSLSHTSTSSTIMPSPLSPSTNGVKKRKVPSDAPSTPVAKAQNGHQSLSKASVSSVEKKSRRHTVGSIRKLFGGSKGSLDLSEGGDNARFAEIVCFVSFD